MRPIKLIRLWYLALLIVAAVTGAQEGELVVAGEGSSPAPSDRGEVFVAANSAYEQGDYPAAIELYSQLVTNDSANGQIHYNLGNAYLRNGELGRAIAELRRGRNLLPRDEDIRANLSFARDSTKDDIAPTEPSPVLSTLLFWHYALSVAELAKVTVVVNLLFWGVAMLRLFHRQSEVLRWLSMVLLVVLVGVAGSLIAHGLVSRPVAVVVPQEIEAYTAPDSDSVVRFKLHAGTELRLKDEREGWLRIVLPDGQQAWIEAVWAEVVDA